MTESNADRSNGLVVVDAVANGHSVEVLLDTGSNFDLVLPRSATVREPWASALQCQSLIRLHNATGAHLSNRYTFIGGFELGDRIIRDLQVVDIDDTTLPPEARLLPIVGTPLLRRFESVMFNFAEEVVTFDRKVDAHSAE
jgi:hypothetical protein